MIQDLVEAALARSSADGCIVIGEERSAANLRWANNGLTTNGQTSARSLTVISTHDAAQGTSVGTVSRTVSTAQEVEQLVRDSERAAAANGPADDAAPLVAAYPVDDDWSAEPARTSIGVFGAFTEGLAMALGAARAGDRALFGFAEHTVSSTFLATSTGLRRRHDQPTGRVELNAKSRDFSRSAYDGVHTRTYLDVDVAAMTEGLTERLGWADREISLPPGRYETILPPSAVGDLMLFSYFASAARDADEGRSAYSARRVPSAGRPADAATAGDASSRTRLGERLATLPLSMYSDPTYAGLQTSPFVLAGASWGGLVSAFDNGLATERTDWIHEGVLTNLPQTRSWADRKGEPARPLIDNLIVDAGGTASLADLIASTERGLLLTTLWYMREVDPQTLLLTGLTRDGVYLVQDGVVQGAVNNFRWNESPIDLLARATEFGATLPTLPREWGDWFTRAAMPAMRVPDFNMSTVSAAA